MILRWPFTTSFHQRMHAFFNTPMHRKSTVEYAAYGREAPGFLSAKISRCAKAAPPSASICSPREMFSEIAAFSDYFAALSFAIYFTAYAMRPCRGRRRRF